MRGTVAVGMGVSLAAGTGVWVGTLICATAVSNAAVMMMFGLTVGVAGWHAANSPASKLNVKI